MRPSRPALLSICLLSLAPAGCGLLDDRPHAVVLIVADTLRADHLGIYGYERPTSPELERLAQDGVVFERAFTTAPWTLPAIGSILTGLLPSRHDGGRVHFDDNDEQQVTGLAPDLTTLTGRLRDAGYATHGIGNAIYVSPGFGFDRGFDEYDWRPARDSVIRTADTTVDLALGWIDEHGDEPFFLFVHMFDPHRHYSAPEPFRGMFTDAFADRYGDTLATTESRNLAEDNLDWPFLVAAYDEEIAFVDHQVGRLIDGLGERGLLGDALVVFTADHGEAMGEHGRAGHGNLFYDGVLRVPLIVWGDGVRPGRRTDPVSVVDIAPTILERAGVAWRRLEPAVDGISLWPALAEEQPLPDRMLFAERAFDRAAERKTIIKWPHKAIIDPESGTRRLYDLADDPQELDDIWADRSDEFYDFLAAMQRLLDAEHQTSELQTLDPELLRSLRALGYVR